MENGIVRNGKTYELIWKNNPACAECDLHFVCVRNINYSLCTVLYGEKGENRIFKLIK